MKRAELTAVEHGLAVMIAFGVATLGQVAVASALIPSATISRFGLAWCLSDAIPTAVALAVIAAMPQDSDEWKRRDTTALRALVAAIVVELLAIGACVALTAWRCWQEGTRVRYGPLVVDVVEGLYGPGRLGMLAEIVGRSAALLLATRAKGTLVEGAALAWPLAGGWCLVLFVGRGFISAALSGPLAFALFLTVLLPIAERATVRAFRALGVTEEQS